MEKKGKKQDWAAGLVELCCSLNRDLGQSGSSEMRLPCRVVLNWGGGCDFIPSSQPGISSFQPKQSMWRMAIEGCLLLSLPVAGGTSLQVIMTSTIYHTRKHNLRPKELWVCRPILTSSVTVASHSFSYPLRVSSGRNQIPGHYVLQSRREIY